MEKLIVTIFNNEGKARSGLEVVRQLDLSGRLSLFEAWMAAKEADGSVRVIEDPDDTSVRVIGAASLTGALLGIFGGPLGLLGGAAAGALIGFIVTLDRAGVTEEFVRDVSTAMTPGKFAVVAYVWENWATPLNERMEALGGVVFRRSRRQVKSMHQDLYVTACSALESESRAVGGVPLIEAACPRRQGVERRNSDAFN